MIRAYGNENWEFNEHGLMKKRYASIDDVPIDERRLNEVRDISILLI